jgi:hypothetical protein
MTMNARRRPVATFVWFGPAAAASADMAPLLPTRVMRKEIVAALAAGGMKGG